MCAFFHQLTERLLYYTLRDDLWNVQQLLESEALNVDVDVRGPQRKTPLHHACFRVNLPIVRVLLKHGACPNIADEGGRTPGHVACRKGSLDIVWALIHAGADWNIYQEGGLTPLHVACISGHAHVANALTYAGADPNAYNDEGVPQAFPEQLCAPK